MNPIQPPRLFRVLLCGALLLATATRMNAAAAADSRIDAYAQNIRTQLQAAKLDGATPKEIEDFARKYLSERFTADSPLAQQILAKILNKPTGTILKPDDAALVRLLHESGRAKKLSTSNTNEWGRLANDLFSDRNSADIGKFLDAALCLARSDESKVKLATDGFKPGTQEYVDELKKLPGGDCPDLPKALTKLATPFDPGVYPRSFFHGGYMSLTPYKPDPKTGALDRSSSDSRGYVEYVFNDHWAFGASDESIQEDYRVAWIGDKQHQPHGSKGSTRTERWWYDRFDTEFRTGFAFGGKGSAATITGSGDFYVDGAFGYRLIPIASEKMRISFGPEVAGGMSTDLSNFRAHPHVLAGVGWHIGLQPLQSSLKNRRAALTFRAGYGFGDAPVLGQVDGTLPNGSAGKVVGVLRDADSRIQFRSMAGGPALESEIFYPLTESTFLAAGGRIYKTGGADQWSFHIGYVISLDKVASALGAAVQ